MKNLLPVISCEHGGNQVPDQYKHLFENATEDLNSHKGWDPGALDWAQLMGKALKAHCFTYEYTRLLIETNRSEHSPELYSLYTNGLSDHQKASLLRNYYRPYRRKVRQAIEHEMEWDYRVVHISMHSFTPVWNGVPRVVEIGLLFDEDRTQEAAFCELWKKHLLQIEPALKVAFNEPYKGKDDGFCTRLRGKFHETNYLGIEVEVNQKFVASEADHISQVLNESLKRTLNEYKNSGRGGTSG